MAKGLSNPWRLTLALFVYEHRNSGSETGEWSRDPNDLVQVAGRGQAAIGEHLHELYVPVATDLHLRTRGGPYSPEQVHGWLVALASNLNDNSAENRVIDGRPLSGTDIAPLELWPIAGERMPLAVAKLQTYLLLFIGTVPPLMFEDRVPGSLVLTWLFLITFASYRMDKAPTWPDDRHLSLRRLRHRESRVMLFLGFVIAFVGALAALFLLAFVVGFFSGSEWVLRNALQNGLAGALSFGLSYGALIGLKADKEALVVRPKDPLRSSLFFALVMTVPGVIVIGAILTFAYSGNGDLGAGLSLRLIAAIPAGMGMAFAFGSGLGVLRYLSLLICTRRWNRVYLPCRLGRFLDWCYGAGLLRISGTSYQFRHRELQDHLARNTVT